jgi:hypothetical protein
MPVAGSSSLRTSEAARRAKSATGVKSARMLTGALGLRWIPPSAKAPRIRPVSCQILMDCFRFAGEWGM